MLKSFTLRKTLRTLCLFTTFIYFGISTNAQLSGTYTINSASPTSGTNFNSITDFTDALSTSGVSGPVVANIVTGSGPYNERMVFGTITGASATNTIRLNGNGETVQYTNTYSNLQMLVFNNTKWVTVNNVKFKTLDASYGWGAIIRNSSSNDSIINCEFDLTSITGASSLNSNGICFTNSYTSPTSAGSNGSDIYIGNNKIFATSNSGGPYYGITVYGGSSYTNSNNTIENNTISNFYVYGAYFYYAKNTKFIGNNINRSTKTSVTTFYGLYAYYSSENLLVSKNKIHSPMASGTTSSISFYGIYTYGPGTSTSPLKVYNNEIYNVKGYYLYGLYINYSLYSQIYHNTVNFDNVTSSTDYLYGMYISSSGTNVQVKNNNINITGGGTSNKYGFYYSASNAVNDAQRNNIYVNAPSGTNYYGYWSPSPYTTKTAFQTAFPAMEVGSTDLDPIFMAPATGNLTPINTGIANAGQNLTASVPTDINNKTRSTTPTPGSVEINAVANNIGTLSLVSPVNFCVGTNSVIAKIGNFGTNTVTSFKVNWRVNGILQTPVSVATTLAAVGTTISSTNVTLGTYSFPVTPSTIEIWTSEPNGVADADPSNDTLNTTVSPSMSGTYTINSASPTSGTNFNTIKDFTDALLAKGVCGPVVANIIAGSGPYNETVKFGKISGTSAVNTIRLNGNGETVQFDNTYANMQLLALDNASYVTVNNVKFKSLNTTYGWGAIITNNSYADSIINCEFDLSSITGSSSLYSNGICFTSSYTSPTSSGSVSGKKIYIGNNTVLGTTGSGGPYYALTMYGTTTAINDSNYVVNNTFQNFYVYGAYIYYAHNLLFKGNNINRSTKTTATTFYGIYQTGQNYGCRFESNRIHSTASPSTSSSFSMYGMMLYGQGLSTNPIVVANNIIYNTTGASYVYGIYLNGASENLIYHNTIDLNKSNWGNYGFYVFGTNTGTRFYNNIINITDPGSGTRYGAYYGGGTASFADIQGNNIYINTTSGTSYWGYLGAFYSTLADFQSANPTLEELSVSLDPDFVDPSTGNYKPNNNMLATTGVNVLSTVPKDIIDVSRTIFPTPGAYQIQPLNNNAAITKLISPHAFCVGSQPITVRIYNMGANDINSLTVQYKLNGVLQPSISMTTKLHALTDTLTPKYIDLTLTTYTFTTAAVSLEVWTKDPNGVADADPSNDTLKTTLRAALGGYYSINSTMPTSGTNYNTITEFVDDVNTYGICTAVEAEIIEGTGPYEEFIEFKNIPGASAVNTLRLYGHGDTVQYNNTSTDRQLLIFNGTKYVTVENIVFKSLDPNYGWAVLVTNNSKYDTVRNCFFDLTATTTTSSVNSAGITFTGSNTSPTTAGNNGSHMYFEGNTILGSDLMSGPYYGLTVYGSPNHKNDSNIFIGNTIQNFYYYGLYAYYATNTKFIGNDINKKTKNINTTFYGLYMSGSAAGNEVRDNMIHSAKLGTPSSGYTFYGIMSYGSGGTSAKPIIIANNSVFNPNQSPFYGIYASTVPYTNFYHNSVSLDQEIPGTYTNYGMYLTGTNTGATVQNNLVSITGGSSSGNYGFYYSSTSSVNNPQRNMIYVNPSLGTGYYGYHAGLYTTMANYKTAYPAFEVGSISVDPELADPPSGALMPSNTAVDGMGLDLTAIVPTDIEGVTRPVPPTPGSWEIDTTQLNNAMAVEFISPEDSFCEGEHEILMVVKNMGLNAIKTMTITYDVNGTTGDIFYTGSIPGYLAAPANIDTISLGNHYFTNGVPVYVTAYTYYPNDRMDNYPANDTAYDSFLATYQIPVNIGPSDTAICKNHSIVLDAGYTGESHIWNTGETTKSISVYEEGTYDVTVITSEGCYGYDTLNLTHVDVIIDLSYEDTPCVEDSLILNAGNPGSTYFWNTGDTTQSITVFSPGNYYVLVTTEIGCVEMDTVTVVFEGNRPVTDGIYATNISTHTFKFETLNPEYVISYEWDFGDGSPVSYEETPTHTYTKEGTFKVTCKVYSTCGLTIYTTFTTIFTDIQNPGVNKNNINIYPNPVKNTLNIEKVGQFEMTAYTVVNNLGQIVKQDVIQPNTVKKQVDLSELNSGTYHIIIHTDNGNISKSFNVIR